MAPNCPKCGAHLCIDLSIALARDSTSAPAPVVVKDATDTPQREHPNQPKEPNQLRDANPPNPPSPASRDAHIRRLTELMVAPLKGPSRPKQPTLRPALSTESGVGPSIDKRTLDVMVLTVCTMLDNMGRLGQPSPDALLEARRRGRGDHELSGRMELVVEALGAVVYDMTWTCGGGPGPKRMRAVKNANAPSCQDRDAPWHMCRRVFELMLFIDYSLPAYPLRRYRRDLSRFERFSRVLTGSALFWVKGIALPGTGAWDCIAREAGGWARAMDGVPVWDIATMLYYYNTRINPSSPMGDHEQGWPQYTGVLQEMIAEIPTRGIARLERKLSLDVHLLIPKCVRDQETQARMMSTARDLAAQHGCKLAPFITLPKTPAWRRWLGSLTGRLLCRESPDGDENGGGKEKLIQGGSEMEKDGLAN